MNLRIKNTVKRIFTLWLAGWVSFVMPAAAFAQEGTTSTTAETTTESTTNPTTEASTTSTGPSDPTGPTEPTGAPACTGAGCDYGFDQGLNQGVDQGGPTLQELGATQNEQGEWVLPEGVANTTQGATNGVTATNSNTGADSANTAQVAANQDTTTTVQNTAVDATTINAAANTGANTGNANTGTSTIKSGDASIGITQVKNDNTTAVNGSVGFNATGHNGDVNGDLELAFNNAIGLLTGDGGSRSIQAVNDSTGSGSSNDIILSTTYNDLTEVQNDGEIDNTLGLSAITGQNQASMNTGNGEITTGDANIAATLINLLNTTVINGALTIDVYDIFGNLNGNIVIPSLAQLATLLGGSQTTVDASNDTTGSDSDNSIDVDITNNEQTNINNDADIDTTVNANAITGQNDASKNTGGGQITTGDGSVQASNVSVANTTVEGGNWALVIVNAFNGWLGFLLGDTGEVKQLSQEETIREIEAQNSNTGSDSTNTIDIDDTTNTTTNVDNNARITNTINADAITGQNTANKNTGAGIINTGDANITTTAVNIANTVVKNATLGIAVINIFGDWFGDLLYEGNSLFAGWGGSGNTTAGIVGANTNTGSESDNTIDVTINNTHETSIDNNADIDTNLNANIDTGNNTANLNTRAGKIITGDGELALHSRAVANVTGIAGPGSLGITFSGENNETGFDSRNKINAEVNEERILNINNNSNVSTLFTSAANTGNNAASFNTGGGEIVTGNIDANVAVHNLINKIVIALGGGVSLDPAVDVDAEMLNQLTGALSTNENNLDVTRNFLLGIFNEATVDTLMDLLLNTGGNATDMNTGGASISTGTICVDGKIVNVVNEVSGKKAATDSDITNNGTVTNDTNINAATGNNQQNMNTNGSQAEERDDECGKIAQAPPEEQPPSDDDKDQPGGGDEDKEEGGPSGGGEIEDKPSVIARIAGVRVAKAEGIKEDMMEKVMGGAAEVSRLADTGNTNRRLYLWIAFAIASSLALAGAIRADQEKRTHRLQYA